MKKMFWIDLEMTGLDERTDKILEVAVIITDLNFAVLDTYHRVVFQEQKILDEMNEWCRENHGKSGLSALVPKGTPLSQVESEMIGLSKKHFSEEKIVVCGNSVGMDKRFIDVHMPEFSKNCHYRVVDVTSFKEIFRSYFGLEVQKAKGHRALDDVRESIGELQYYMDFLDREKAKAAVATQKQNKKHK